MANLEQNRRRNQIIAERAQDKARRDLSLGRWTDEQLWHAVEECVRGSSHTQRWMGHPDKAVDAIVAEMAINELKLRGIQLSLPV